MSDSDFATKMPCSDEHPVMRITVISICIIMGMSVVWVSVYALKQYIQTNKELAHDQKIPRSFFMVHLIYLVFCAVYGIVHPVSIAAQCRIFALNAWVITTLFWTQSFVCCISFRISNFRIPLQSDTTKCIL